MRKIIISQHILELYLVSPRVAFCCLWSPSATIFIHFEMEME